jgi:hypothetical protein
MTSRGIALLLSWLALTALIADEAAAQSVAYGDAAALPRAALADAYYVRLESAWPQTTGAVGACRNGGEEVVEGLLQRGVDGVYRGTLDRRTRLLFCGAHAASGVRCELVLEGGGQVATAGYAVPDDASPSGSALRLSWRPTPSHRGTARGECSSDFKRSVEEMYRSVTHGVEFAVPEAGAEKRAERLIAYPWTVEVGGR